ncbi:hypothetical protein [Photobacterium nomapromontoriensis]|uniref:hypothetical protein n=1 Tax=Photobacterium nomapromontoriensis TaxID=2910237 RepID=UPI003D0FF242
MQQSIYKSVITLSMLFMACSASANDFIIKDLTNSAIENSSFPFFSSEIYPQSASNINTFLQYEMLDKVYEESDFSKVSTSPFKNTEYHRRNFYFYDYKIKENTNYIEVSISGDGCGAYCEEFTRNFVFDTYTGQPITIIDFLSPQGRIQLEQKIRDKNIERIEPYIKKEPDVSFEEEHDMYIMYKYCHDDMLDEDSYANRINQNTSFELLDSGLVIKHGRCSNHALRALDEIGTFVNNFSFDELKPYLSQAGEKYLSNQPYQLPEIKTEFKIRYGKIDNKYPITVIHTDRSGWVYWYDKYKAPIDLYEGSRTGTGNNTLVLKESYYDEGKGKTVYTARWNITENKGVYSGTFTRLSDLKEMVVSFQ